MVWYGTEILPKLTWAVSVHPSHRTIAISMSAHQELIAATSELAAGYAALGNRLSLAAGELSNLGTPPAAGLIQDIDRYRQRFEALRDQVIALAKTSGLPAGSIPSNVVSVRELDALVKSLSPLGTPETVQAQALALLDRILGVTLRGGEPLSSLSDAQTQARHLRGTIASASPASLPQVALSLVQGNHPLADLLVMLDEGDRLDDARWAKLQDSVSHAFDRSLAAAAARGRLVAPPPVAVTPVAPASAPQTSVQPLVAADVVFGASAPAGPPKKRVPLKVTVHIQGLGDRTFGDDDFAGTRGESRHLEGLSIEFAQRIPGLGIRYLGHVQNVGDTAWAGEGEYIGTKGQGLRLEGFLVELTGPEATKYDVHYLGHFARYGDSNVMSNGELCGVRGEGLTIEAVKVWVEAKA